MRYYLKRCGHQELGSIKDGKAQRGRYLLNSMYLLDFFPSLTTAQHNDSALMPIIPLYSGKKVYCNYVYHNDKFHGSTATHPRNEYRIYLNKELEGGRYLFSEGDIVIMRVHDLVEEEGNQRVFLLDLVQDTQSALYRELNAKIDASFIRGAYAAYDGVISEFENKATAMLTQPDQEVFIDSSVTKQIEKAGPEAIAGLFNSVSFRDFVMVGYESRCAITGSVIRYESYMNLEAAHIKPKSHGGLFMPNNGIALSRDMHWAFDKGFYTISKDYKVKVHPQTTSDWLKSFDGKEIRVPKDPFFRPNIESLVYHDENVYGLFLASGRL